MNKGIKLHWLLIGVFLVNFGNSFVWPLTTVYIHNQLHHSLTVAGVVILFYSGANVVGSYFAGNLFDRHNPQHLMLWGLIGAVITMLIMVFENGWPIYPVMLTLVGFFNGWLVTLHNSYGTKADNADGRYVFNMIYFANNLGMVCATSAVGPLYQWTHNQVGPLFLMTVILYSFFSVLVFFFYRVPVPEPSQPQHHEQVAQLKKAADIKLPHANSSIIWTLSISLCIVWILYTQWSSNLSVYLTGMGMTMTNYSMLWTVNGLMIVFLQPVMNVINRYIKHDYLKIYIGITTIGLSFVTLIIGRAYWWFVAGMVVLTLGEILVFPTIPAIINQLSPNEVKGHFQGILNALISLGKAIGPVFGGIMIEHTSYQLLFDLCLVSLIIIVVVTALMISKMSDQTVEY